MEINLTPYYIQDAISRRAKAAKAFLNNDDKITHFCEKNGIELKFIGGNTETITNPDMVAEITLQEIEKQLLDKRRKEKGWE